MTASRTSGPLDPGAAHRAAERLATTTPSRLPTTPAAAGVLLAAMPGIVAGAARTRSRPQDVTWAKGSAVTAAPLAEAAAPGQSMRQFFDASAASGQFTVACRSGPSDRLLWFVGTGNQTGGPRSWHSRTRTGRGCTASKPRTGRPSTSSSTRSPPGRARSSGA